MSTAGPNPMYASMGLSIGEGITGFATGMIEASLASKLQKYRNKMLEITAAMTGNAINLNKIATRDASIRLSFALQQKAVQDQGAAEVAAAAAGVAGQSVNATMRGLRASAAAAQAARKAQRASEFRGHFQEQRNVRLAVVTGKDVTVLARPSLLSHAVGLGKTLLDDYDAAQPPGDKLGDQYSDWWE